MANLRIVASVSRATVASGIHTSTVPNTYAAGRASLSCLPKPRMPSGFDLIPSSASIEICDCGEVKRFGREACPRCVALDGNRDSSVVLYVLRDYEPRTLEDVVHDAQIAERNARHALKRLMRIGRVRQWLEDTETTYQRKSERSAAQFGLEGRTSGTRAVYALRW